MIFVLNFWPSFERFLTYVFLPLQTEVTHVITTHELLPKFKSVLHRTPTVKYMIYLEDQVPIDWFFSMKSPVWPDGYIICLMFDHLDEWKFAK